MERVSQDVQSLLVMGKTYQEISAELKQLYADMMRGLSARSVRRYVQEKSLELAVNRNLVEVVEESVQEVRRTLQLVCNSTIIRMTETDQPIILPLAYVLNNQALRANTYTLTCMLNLLLE